MAPDPRPTPVDAASGPGRLGPGDHVVGLTHGGVGRSFLLHVPPQAADAPRPLVVCFHGGGSNARQQRRYSRLDATADRHGFVVAYPDGTGVRPGQRRFLTFNAGGCCPPASRRGVDDVGFTAALVRFVADTVAVDPHRLYATGMSNGGMMAHRLGVELPQLAAVASVAGQLNVRTFAPTRPVPVLEFHSVDDARALYAGGGGPRLGRRGGALAFPPVEEGLARWAAHDGCPTDPAVGPTRWGAPGSPDQGQSVTTVVWGPGREGSEVVLHRFTGVGHVWPGAPTTLPRLLGRATALLDANEELWRFFAAHPRAAVGP